jgi:hypothetical protein
MSDVVDAVAVVQVGKQDALVIHYLADCGACDRPLWRRASFRTVPVDYIVCEHCLAMNRVRRPK